MTLLASNHKAVLICLVLMQRKVNSVMGLQKSFIKILKAKGKKITPLT